MKKTGFFNAFMAIFVSLIFNISIACEVGWQEIEHDSGSFCIEESKQINIKSHEIYDICESKGARVCSTDQWVKACQGNQLHTDGWEWSISLGQYPSITGNRDCSDLGFGELSPVANLRCCK
ncbi:MAG: hypothetical protein HOP07_06490 [Bacteriovoracaceae bacterium]|nr:hypothetical protein [Bacteriovoracaceae bacterium]